MLPFSEESYTQFIDLIKKKISNDFYPVSFYETPTPVNEFTILGVENFKCVKKNNSILIFYSIKTIPYVIILLYSIAWNPTFIINKLVIRGKTEIKHEEISTEEFVNILINILKNEKFIILEIDKNAISSIFGFIFYIKTPYKHDLYYLIESCKIRHVKWK